MSHKTSRKPKREPSRASAQVLPARRGVGQPTKCTPELMERLCALVKTGVPAITACRAEHVGKTTLHMWRKSAAAGVEPYATLLAQLDGAQSKAIAAITMHLVKASTHDWRAAAWWLERRAPALFNLQQHVRVEQAPVELTDEELAAAMERYGYVRAPRQDEDDDNT